MFLSKDWLRGYRFGTRLPSNPVLSVQLGRGRQTRIDIPGVIGTPAGEIEAKISTIVRNRGISRFDHARCQNGQTFHCRLLLLEAAAVGTVGLWAPSRESWNPIPQAHKAIPGTCWRSGECNPMQGDKAPCYCHHRPAYPSISTTRCSRNLPVLVMLLHPRSVLIGAVALIVSTAPSLAVHLTVSQDSGNATSSHMWGMMFEVRHSSIVGGHGLICKCRISINQEMAAFMVSSSATMASRGRIRISAPTDH